MAQGERSVSGASWRRQAHTKAPRARVAGTTGLICAGALVIVHDMPTLTLTTRRVDRQGYRHLEPPAWSVILVLFIL
jgi:hypothetical protein